MSQLIDSEHYGVGVDCKYLQCSQNIENIAQKYSTTFEMLHDWMTNTTYQIHGIFNTVSVSRNTCFSTMFSVNWIT